LAAVRLPLSTRAFQHLSNVVKAVLLRPPERCVTIVGYSIRVGAPFARTGQDAGAVTAQEHGIEGFVVDDQNKPIPGVLVRVYHEDKSAAGHDVTTDSYGYYKIVFNDTRLIATVRYDLTGWDLNVISGLSGTRPHRINKVMQREGTSAASVERQHELAAALSKVYSIDKQNGQSDEQFRHSYSAMVDRKIGFEYLDPALISILPSSQKVTLAGAEVTFADIQGSLGSDGVMTARLLVHGTTSVAGSSQALSVSADKKSATLALAVSSGVSKESVVMIGSALELHLGHPGSFPSWHSSCQVNLRLKWSDGSVTEQQLGTAEFSQGSPESTLQLGINM
jgi:hypothetical protein